MFGVILISIGTFFEEISDTIGKHKVSTQQESPYTMAFLSLFWGAIFFALICLIKNNAFVFRLESLPTFLTRAALEIMQLYISVLAIIRADRTTFSFVRTITIPLLLLVDLILGYKIGLLPIAGITLIIIALFVIFSNHGIKKQGISLVIFSAINGVFTTSLFKFNITHFNSVAAEQLLINLILLICFFILAIIKGKENPLFFLTKPIFFLQSASTGLGGVLESFSFNYGAASIMMAAKRSSAIFWSILSGKAYFKEKNVLIKIIVFFILLLGLILLALN
jgi:hypothetical protein